MANIKLEKLIAIGVAAVLVIVLLFSSITFIPTGYTGVKVALGQISETPVMSGPAFKIPFIQSIKKVNNKLQDTTIKDKIWAETKERTAVYFEGVTVSFQVTPEMSAWLYANVADHDNLINLGLVSSAVKTVAKQSPVVDVTDRAKVEPEIAIALQHSVNGKYGEGVLIITKVVVADIDYEEDYQAAVAAKQKAQLQYEKQQIENQKAIEKAEADAKAKIKKAEGEAEAKRIAAEAEAEANKKIAQGLNDKVLSNKFYEKWDGVLPKVTGDASVMLPSSILN
jgi:regulator of protease activity HflC (stomatin/prohibitin superfamily)